MVGTPNWCRQPTAWIVSALTLCAMGPDLAQTVRMSSSNLTVAALFRLNRWSSGAVLLDWEARWLMVIVSQNLSG